MFEQVPEELKQSGKFCVWKYELNKDGKQTKVPYNPNDPEHHAHSDDEGTFSSLRKAVEIYDAGGFDGIGLGVFGDLCGIDLDHCYNGGILSRDARQIVDQMKTYTEISPGGDGIRMISRTKPGYRYDKEEFYVHNKNRQIEIYVAGSTNKFLTITGNVFEKRFYLEERTFELGEVTRKFMRRPAKTEPTEILQGVDLPEDEIILKASNAQNGEKFRRLWSGDTSGYSSQSEADAALCGILAFWTGNDAGKMDSLFRQSCLFREKWDSKRGSRTYGEITIQEAIRGNTAVYNPQVKAEESLEPTDYTDVGQAKIFVDQYGDRVRYSPATKYLVYNGRKWEENELKAQLLSQTLTERQLGEARTRLSEARAALDAAVESGDEDAAKAAKPSVKKAEKFRDYALKRRFTNQIKHTLTEAAPSVQIEVDQLDADGYLLNTPAGTVDLRSGKMQSHKAGDHCTKITALAPSTEGSEIWSEFLQQITCGDKDLQRYLQDIAGICTIGHVKREELIIATGSGGNGKSTFFNLLFRILGDYAGMLSAETLTTGSRNNKSPEYAELRGKRMIIAAELEEGTRLDTSTVKKLCSTDTIIAEKKYRDPFHFVPSHHVILYTNHLPKVGTNDAGTWARLVVVPFNAKFRGQAEEVKDYAGYLYEHCGGAALSWMIEGARRVIDQEFLIRLPLCVQGAVSKYRADNDWIGDFISECCVVTDKARVAAGDLQSCYRRYCLESGVYTRNSTDLANALEVAGFEGRKTNRGKYYFGIGLKG